ncbi:response regulator, partial [Chloroflexota bacterium]
GTGLSLSICHGIVTEHGGRIYAESELGQGATFILELPLPAVEGESKENLDIGSGKTILVIEDEPSILKLCSKTLTSVGFEVDIAANGRVAQGKVEEKSYALFLIDIRIPEMNGMEFFRWLGSSHPDMAGRVIFTTGDVMVGETVHFIEQSGMPFLPKPFTPDELQSIVIQTLIHMGSD